MWLQSVTPRSWISRIGCRDVVGRFDSGRVTSDGGGLLLREVDVRLGMLSRLGAAGGVEELQRIVGQIRARWPTIRIVIRGDSGFCREAIISWCEENRVGYVLGRARNQRLYRALGRELADARAEHAITGKPSRQFRDFRYQTRKSWPCERRLVGKIE